MPYGNIMYDRRIVRGNTYAQRTLPAVSVAEEMKMLFVCSLLNKWQHKSFCLLSSWITKTEVINLFNILDFQFTYASSGLVFSGGGGGGGFVFIGPPPPPPSQEEGNLAGQGEHNVLPICYTLR